MAIASTCRMARSAEKTVSGDVAGTGDGGRVTRRTEMAHSTASPNAVATRVAMLSFMRSLRLTVEASFYYHDTSRGAFHARRDATCRRQDGLGGGRSRRHAANHRAHVGGGRIFRAYRLERRRSA